jgi:hypothetical protein
MFVHICLHVCVQMKIGLVPDLYVILPTTIVRPFGYGKHTYRSGTRQKA